MSDPGSASFVPASTPEQAAHAQAILRLLDRPIDPVELDAGASLAARAAESESSRSLRVLMFRIGEEAAALPAKLLRRVTPAARAIPIPHRTGGVLRGVCNIRGELVLCADLHRLLGLPERAEATSHAEATAHADAPSDPRRMVVIGPADNSWAFEVDALMGVESADPDMLRPPPVTVEYSIGAFTIGIAEIGARSVTILDGERILAGFKAALA